MTAIYTRDIFSSVDGYGSNNGNWGVYWGKQGPELLAHRLSLFSQTQHMIFGANTYRAYGKMLKHSDEQPHVLDPWGTQMRKLPATVTSSTLKPHSGSLAVGPAKELTHGRLEPDADVSFWREADR